MLRHAHIHIVVSQMPQRSDSVIFYKRKRCTTTFLIECFQKKMGASALRLRGLPGPNLIFWKKFYQKHCCASVAFVKSVIVAFLSHLTHHIMNLCVSEHFQFAKRLKFVLCELSQLPKKRIRVHFCARVLLKKKFAKLKPSLFSFQRLFKKILVFQLFEVCKKDTTLTCFLAFKVCK